jgi:uncharacterized protein involved in response to NO
MKSRPSIFFSYAFRPFFLMNGIFAIAVILAWVITLHGSGIPGLTPMWHSHEMLVGFAMAAVAGFSLTAVANWTGRPAVQGTPLVWLVFCWVAGRLAMLFAGWLPASFVALLDMLFPLLLCGLLGREIFGGKSKRNYILVIILAFMAFLNGIYHLGVSQAMPGADRLAVFLLIHTKLVLVTIITGRIVPSFTGNWLRMQGQSRLPVNSDLVNQAALSLTVLVGLAASFAPTHTVTGVLAFAAAGTHGFRLSRWRGFATTSNPLVFVLHAAYIWLPVGYVLLGCAVFGWLFTPTAALHALTMGAIGNIVLAVTTRVSLGHTGRPLQVARVTVAAYWLLMIAVLVRVLGPLSGQNYLLMIDLSAAGWILAFAIFVWVYWPILTRQKPDSTSKG